MAERPRERRVFGRVSVRAINLFVATPGDKELREEFVDSKYVRGAYCNAFVGGADESTLLELEQIASPAGAAAAVVKVAARRVDGYVEPLNLHVYARTNAGGADYDARRTRALSDKPRYELRIGNAMVPGSDLLRVLQQQEDVLCDVLLRDHALEALRRTPSVEKAQVPIKDHADVPRLYLRVVIGVAPGEDREAAPPPPPSSWPSLLDAQRKLEREAGDAVLANAELVARYNYEFVARSFPDFFGDPDKKRRSGGGDVRFGFAGNGAREYRHRLKPRTRSDYTVHMPTVVTGMGNIPLGYYFAHHTVRDAERDMRLEEWLARHLHNILGLIGYDAPEQFIADVSAGCASVRYMKALDALCMFLVDPALHAKYRGDFSFLLGNKLQALDRQDFDGPAGVASSLDCEDACIYVLELAHILRSGRQDVELTEAHIALDSTGTWKALWQSAAGDDRAARRTWESPILRAAQILLGQYAAVGLLGTVQPEADTVRARPAAGKVRDDSSDEDEDAEAQPPARVHQYAALLPLKNVIQQYLDAGALDAEALDRIRLALDATGRLMPLSGVVLEATCPISPFICGQGSTDANSASYRADIRALEYKAYIERIAPEWLKEDAFAVRGTNTRLRDPGNRYIAVPPETPTCVRPQSLGADPESWRTTDFYLDVMYMTCEQVARLSDPDVAKWLDTRRSLASRSRRDPSTAAIRRYAEGMTCAVCAPRADGASDVIRRWSVPLETLLRHGAAPATVGLVDVYGAVRDPDDGENETADALHDFALTWVRPNLPPLSMDRVQGASRLLTTMEDLEAVLPGGAGELRQDEWLFGCKHPLPVFHATGTRHEGRHILYVMAETPALLSRAWDAVIRQVVAARRRMHVCCVLYSKSDLFLPGAPMRLAIGLQVAKIDIDYCGMLRGQQGDSSSSDEREEDGQGEYRPPAPPGPRVENVVRVRPVKRSRRESKLM